MLVAGWALLLTKATLYALNMKRWDGHVPGLYDNIRLSMLVFQTAALLEVLHSALGLVSSGVMTTLMQVYSRVFIVWAIVEGVSGASENIGLLLVCFAWGITEVVRYSYYFCALLDSIPYFLQWCRYTFFFVLYPLGVLGEMLLYFASLPVIRARHQWSLSLPNNANISFSFYYFLIFTMLLYIPLFPQLYGHMIRQRRKVIGGQRSPTPPLKKTE